MTYNVLFAQRDVLSVAPELKGKLKEMIIVCWLPTFLSAKFLKHKADDDGNVYYWIHYQKVLEELPCLDVSKDSIYRCFKLLENIGLLKAHPHNRSSGKTYFMMTDKFTSIYRDVKRRTDTERKAVNLGEKNNSFGKFTERDDGFVRQIHRTDNSTISIDNSTIRPNENLDDKKNEVVPGNEKPVFVEFDKNGSEIKIEVDGIGFDYIDTDEKKEKEKKEPPRKKKKKPDRKPGDPFPDTAHTQQEFMIAKKTFNKYHAKAHPGQTFIWNKKEQGNLRRFIGMIKQGMETKQIEINNRTLYDNLSGFMELVCNMSDPWHRTNFFTPTGFYSQFQNILNRANDGKRNIKNFERKIADYLNNS